MTAISSSLDFVYNPNRKQQNKVFENGPISVLARKCGNETANNSVKSPQPFVCEWEQMQFTARRIPLSAPDDAQKQGGFNPEYNLLILTICTQSGLNTSNYLKFTIPNNRLSNSFIVV